jgi:WD40 repeat protein
MRLSHRILLLTLTALMGIVGRTQAQDDPIQIAEPKREDMVDFQKEILPIFRRNCLACHNSTEAESDLILETPQAILKGGGEGPGVVAGNPAESLILLQASRQQESFMPPDGNDVGAKALTPEELGLIQLWIKQGAKGDVSAAEKIEWQPLPSGVNPIYASAVSADGRYAVASRANQIFLYHVPSGRPLGRLTDPSLAKDDLVGTAHLDLVQSLVITQHGERIVSGGFRNAKVWKKTSPSLKSSNDVSSDITAINGTGNLLIAGLADGHLLLVADGSPQVLGRPSEQAVQVVSLSPDGTHAVCVDAANNLFVVAIGSPGQTIASTQLPAKTVAIAAISNDRIAVATENTKEIAIWQVSTEEGKPATLAAAAPIPGHAQPVTTLLLIGDKIISASAADGDVRIWNVADSKQVRQIQHGGPTVSVAASTDGAIIVTAAEKECKIWNVADGKQLQTITVDAVKAFAKDELTRKVALAKRRIDLTNGDLKAATDRKTAEEANTKKSQEELTKAEADLKTKTEAATKAVAEKDAEQKKLDDAVATIAKTDETIKAYDVTLTATAKIKTDSEAAAKTTEPMVKKLTEAETFAGQAAEKSKQAAAILADDKELAALAAATQKASDGIKVRRAAAAVELKKYQDAIAKSIVDAKTATDAKAVAVAAKTAAEAAMKTATAAVKAKTDPATKAVDAKTAADRGLASAKRSVERAGQAVVRATEAIPPVEATVKVETAAHVGLGVELVKATEIAQQSLSVARVAISADHLTVAGISTDGTVRLWDSATGSELDLFSAANGPAVFSTDSLVIATGKSLQTWNTELGWELERTHGSVDAADVFVDRVTAMAISPDQTLLATGSGEPSRSGQIKIWNLESGELVRELENPHSDTVFSIDFSRDGKLLASSAADRFMKVFQVSDGAFVRSFEGHTHHVLAVAWSADGRSLATGGADNVVKVWNALTGDQSRTIAGFGKEVTDIEFVGDTGEIVTTCGDAGVSRKRTDNGGNVRGFAGASDFVYTVSVPADGAKVIAGGQDSVLRIWNAADGKLLTSFTAPVPDPTVE